MDPADVFNFGREPSTTEPRPGKPFDQIPAPERGESSQTVQQQTTFSSLMLLPLKSEETEIGRQFAAFLRNGESLGSLRVSSLRWIHESLANKVEKFNLDPTDLGCVTVILQNFEAAYNLLKDRYTNAYATINERRIDAARSAPRGSSAAKPDSVMGGRGWYGP